MRISHTHFLVVKASDNYRLGGQLGEIFRQEIRDRADAMEKSFTAARGFLTDSFNAVKNGLPEYAQEIKGYAEAAGISKQHMLAVMMEDELDECLENRSSGAEEHCSTLATNAGSLIAHNEDWDEESQDRLWVLRREVGPPGREQVNLELLYSCTLGGNSFGVNSAGFTHAVNSLTHPYPKGAQPGISRNIIARWMSDTQNPQQSFEILSRMKKISGYSHTIVDTKNKSGWNIECNQSECVATNLEYPYVHTNHYLNGAFAHHNDVLINDPESTTFRRFDDLTGAMGLHMSVSEVKKLLSRRKECVFRPETIGRMIVDAPKGQAHIWLAREKKAGWISYDLP